MARARSGSKGQKDSQEQSNPPRCKDSPKEGKQERIFRVNNSRMTDREILDTDVSRYQVVKDAVPNGCDDARQNDPQRLHGVSIPSSEHQ